jgi:hypothetical protein
MEQMTTERQRIVAGNLAGVAIAFLLFIAPLSNALKLSLMVPTIIITGRSTRREQITQAEVNQVLYDGLTSILGETRAAIDRGYQAFAAAPTSNQNIAFTSATIVTEMIKPHLPQFKAEVNWRELYRKCLNEKFLVITGKSREGKSMVAHQLLYEFCLEQQNALVLIHDSDYGVSQDAKFIPDWCNLPAFDVAPSLLEEEIKSQVVTGEDEFASLVNLGYSLFEERNSSKKSPFPLLLIFDDVTTRIGELGDEREAIQTKLRKMATRGKKYGIHVWILTHSVTNKESGFDASLFDNSCLICGVMATKNNYAKQRFDIDPDVWQLGCEKRRDQERAFITTHPDIPNGYLPAPRFNSTAELHLPWGEAVSGEERATIDLQRTLNQRLQLPEVQMSIKAYMAREINQKQCFQAVWGKALSGKRFLESRLLKEYIKTLDGSGDIDDESGEHVTLFCRKITLV